LIFDSARLDSKSASLNLYHGAAGPPMTFNGFAIDYGLALRGCEVSCCGSATSIPKSEATGTPTVTPQQRHNGSHGPRASDDYRAKHLAASKIGGGTSDTPVL
jgi:hypothetical protein